MELDFFGNTPGSTGGGSGLMGLGGTAGSWTNPAAAGGNKFLGLTGTDFLGAGLSILGGIFGSKESSKDRKAQERMMRAQLEAQQRMQREQLRAQMQSQQDDYSRTIMRNRAAIAPWGQMYSGPRFTNANPNAPIYNPLMERDHPFSAMAPTSVEAPNVP